MAIINNPSQNTWRIPWHLVIIFSLMAAGILGLGYVYYKYQETLLQSVKAEELKSIADMKVKQIVTWRRQRLNDTRLIVDDPIFANQVQDFFNGTGSLLTENDIRQRLGELYQGSYVEGSYVQAVLFDSQGRIRMSISKVRQDHMSLIKLIALKTMNTGKIILTDLYFLHKSEEINMSLAIPIRLLLNGKTTVIGAVVYQIDPYYFLYPILQSWPTPSKTGELVMVRRDKAHNTITFLNELRQHRGAPLVLRKSLTETQIPSVKAALGEEGVVRGVDYRGAPVLAVNRVIPDSPWFLTAKIDIAEVNGPLRRWSYLIPILTTTMIAAAGLGVALMWRNRDVQFYRQQFLSESERRFLSQRYEYLMKYAYDIILLMDRDWQIIEANDRALESYGYNREELLNLHLWDLVVDGHSVTKLENWEQEVQNGFRFEATNCRKDGTTFPAEISSSLIEMGASRIYQYIIRDVSERKSKEKALQESEQQLRYLSSQLLIVQENERRWISNELHDELGQSLMILKFQISSIESRLSKNQKTLRKECQDLLQYLDDSIENVRRLSRDLSPLALEQFGLVPAIKNLLENFSKHYNIQWDPSQIEILDNLFSPLSQVNIYRIFQESLTNIGRHAQATNILIGIEKQNGYITFTIEDNGKGFDPQAILNPENRQRGIGLVTMHERSRMAGGHLQIRSRPEAGTQLTLTVPTQRGE
jgi:PAS domain S-box-containing protein